MSASNEGHLIQFTNIKTSERKPILILAKIAVVLNNSNYLKNCHLRVYQVGHVAWGRVADIRAVVDFPVTLTNDTLIRTDSFFLCFIRVSSNGDAERTSIVFDLTTCDGDMDNLSSESFVIDQPCAFPAPRV